MTIYSYTLRSTPILTLKTDPFLSQSQYAFVCVAGVGRFRRGGKPRSGRGRHRQVRPSTRTKPCRGVRVQRVQHRQRFRPFPRARNHRELRVARRVRDLRYGLGRFPNPTATVCRLSARNYSRNAVRNTDPFLFQYQAAWACSGWPGWVWGFINGAGRCPGLPRVTHQKKTWRRCAGLRGEDSRRLGEPRRSKRLVTSRVPTVRKTEKTRKTFPRKTRRKPGPFLGVRFLPVPPCGPWRTCTSATTGVSTCYWRGCLRTSRKSWGSR